jgi:single-strand DNA-binding protein
MASFNSVTLLGNCVRDPELKYTPSGKAVVDLSLAINKNWTDESGQKREDVTFVDCTAFGRTAEICGEYLKKGSPVFLSGHLKQDTWEDKQTGAKRSKLKVTIDNLQLLGSRDSGSEAASPVGNQPPQRQSAPPARATAPAGKSQSEPDWPDNPPF